MTCIVGLLNKGKVYIGGDSAGVAGLDVSIRKDPKVFRNGKMLFGYTTSFRMGQLIRFSLKIPDHPHGMDDYEYMGTKFLDAVRKCLKDGGYSEINNNTEKGGKFLVGYNKKLYEIESDFQVALPSRNYLSVGCGSSYALGTLKVNSYIDDPEQRIKQALQTAVYFSGGVRPPFKIESL